jgi:hypothetical protein
MQRRGLDAGVVDAAARRASKGVTGVTGRVQSQASPFPTADAPDSSALHSTQAKVKSQDINCEYIMEQEVGNDNELVKPTWKKARTSRSKKAADVAPVNLTYSAPKKRAGKLAMLPEMPLDVLYEVSDGSNCAVTRSLP